MQDGSAAVKAVYGGAPAADESGVEELATSQLLALGLHGQPLERDAEGVQQGTCVVGDAVGDERVDQEREVGCLDEFVDAKLGE